MLKSVTVVSKWGEVLQVFKHASSLSIEANANPNGIIIPELPPIEGSFWDFSLECFVPTGDMPTPHHKFNYVTKSWEDTRSILEIKAQKWAEIKLQRNQLEFGGFEFDGDVYDSDQVSQGRIMGAAVAGIDQTWTLADNTTVELTALQLQQLYAALQTHIAGAHERGRIARQLIFEAETKEQVEAIQL